MDINDWRNRGQDDYLKGVTLHKRKFQSMLPKNLEPRDDPRNYSDHEHCEFCWHKFMEDCSEVKDCSTEGYCTLDGRLWICENCFNDFKDSFNWTVIS